MLDGPIARRYFVMNFFDGIMTAFGIVVGGAAAIGEAAPLIKAGLGASLAIMVSGFFGAYMVERAERTVELKELERQLLRSLEGTEREREARKKVIRLAFIDGISPFLGAVLPILPYFCNLMGLVSYSTATVMSLVLSLVLLLCLGFYLGKLMGESPWRNALTFGAGGVVIGVLSTLLERFI